AACASRHPSGKLAKRSPGPGVAVAGDPARRSGMADNTRPKVSVTLAWGESSVPLTAGSVWEPCGRCGTPVELAGERSYVCVRCGSCGAVLEPLRFAAANRGRVRARLRTRIDAGHLRCKACRRPARAPAAEMPDDSGTASGPSYTAAAPPPAGAAFADEPGR